MCAEITLYKWILTERMHAIYNFKQYKFAVFCIKLFLYSKKISE